MKNLIMKELRLAMQPPALLFLALSALILIPSYPGYIVFFYTCLGIFFICMLGRENKDIYYTMLLPVPKRSVVGARFFTVVLLELAQLAIAAPFAAIRGEVAGEIPLMGMDANAAFFGFSFVMFGIFNLVFLTGYYKDTNKVGVPFLWGCVATGVFIVAAEAAAYAVPFVRDTLNVNTPENLAAQLATLAVGVAAYALLTLAAYKKSVKSFELLDL